MNNSDQDDNCDINGLHRLAKSIINEMLKGVKIKTNI